MPRDCDLVVLALLACRWIHSHEDDTSKTIVYRPGGYSFPPSRGRDGFQLHADGTLILSAPGPADRSREQAGEWELRDDEVLVFTDSTGERSRELGQIITVDSRRLIIRR